MLQIIKTHSKNPKYPKNLKSLSIIRSWSLVATLAMLAIASTGCGKSMVTGVTISTQTINNDRYADLDIKFKTNGIVLPTIALPIFDPQNPSVNFGELELKQISSTLGEAKVGVNLSVVAKLPSQDPLLPNGNAAPLAGASTNAKIVSIPIPTTEFVLYVALEMNAMAPAQSPVLMVGLALPFRQLDNVGQNLGNSQLFLPFNVQGVAGTAGFFGSKESGKSGFAFFVDFSGLIPQQAPTSSAQLASQAVAPGAVPVIPVTQKFKRMNFLYQHPGVKAELKLKQGLSRLGKNRTQLTPQ